uniref:Decapping nuclease n=1 Tax=Tetranychus urticae TaxID=32264 RepID=T1KE38_TETUR
MGRIRRDALDLELLLLIETKEVEFTGPKRIGCFSTCYGKGNELVYRTDNSSQRYLVSTELNEPLYCLEGFNPDTDKCLLPITWPDFFRWISSNEEIIHRSRLDKSKSSIDFICSNAVMKHIMLSPFTEVDWIINAIKIKRTIFMFVTDIDLSKKRKQQSDNNTRQNKLAYSRFKVIKKITKQVAERESDSNTELDVLSTVSISKIGQHHVLHLGNSEFVLSKDDVEKPIDQASFAALKLVPNLYKGDNKDFNIKDYRLMYWWASALLCGVETLICGDLNEDYNLRELDVLPASILNENYLASQKKCFIALDKILDFIKSKVKKSNKFYDVHFNAKKASREVTASLSVSLFEDLASSKIPVSLNMLKNFEWTYGLYGC